MSTSLKTKKTTGKIPTFVFLVDSYHPHYLEQAFHSMGLEHGVHYYSTGAGGAEIIMMDRKGGRMADAENLLVIMSTFHGEVEPAIELCKQVQAVNSKARFIFRSKTDSPSDPMFEQCLDKYSEDDDKIIAIVKEMFNK